MRSPDRLRQPGQPAARPGSQPSPRAGGANRDRCRPRKTRPATDDGEPPARGRRWSAWNRHRRRLCPAAGAARARDAADRGDTVGRCSRPPRRSRTHSAHRDRVRSRADPSPRRQSGPRWPPRGRSIGRRAEGAPQVGTCRGGGDRIGCIAGVRGSPHPCLADCARDRSWIQPRRRAHAADRAADAGVRSRRRARDVLHARPSGDPGAARCAGSRLHQLPADFIVPRRRVACLGQGRHGRGAGHPKREQRGGHPVRHARLLPGDGDPAQAGARHRRGRRARSSAGCGGERVVRQTLLAE